jgi:ACS family glucarate transporter-like MFS transporter
MIFSSAPFAGLPTQATRVRYRVLAWLCSLSFILYIDRLCISKAAPQIEQELGITHTAMGFVFGAFTVAYGLFEIPTGRWGDRFGSRGVLMRIVIWWSAFTVLTGCVWPFRLDSGYRIQLSWIGISVPLLFDSFLLLLLIRFLFGAGEAGALPNAARVVARWFPAGGRGPAQGMINTAALIGGAVAPVIAAYVIELRGWRWAFFLFGLLGMVWAVAFYRWFRDSPAEHPAVNEAERRLIAAGAAGPPTTEHPPVPWGRVLRSANVWLLGGVITCSAFVSYMYFFWYPTYLEEGRGVDRILAGWLSGLVLAGGAVGGTLGGYLSDGLIRLTGDRRRSRRLIGCCGLGGAAIALLASVECEGATAASCFAALACLSSNAVLATWWGAVTEISGKHLGSLFGLMNSMGVPGAVASQLFFGRFADWMKEYGFRGRDQWDLGFYLYAAVLVAGAFGWLFVDVTKPVADATETALP